MPSYENLLREGRLAAAIDAAVNDVRTAPSNVSQRIALFEMLAAAGDFDRARKHLDVVADKRPDMLEAVTSYMGVLAAEKRRQDIFEKGEGEPEQVAPIPPALWTQMGVLRLLKLGDHSSARALIDAADGQPIRATVDGEPCEDLRDADDFFAQMIEVIAQGRYGWLPLSGLTRIVIDPPKHFRDLLWLPATVHLQGGLNAAMLLPTRYPGSETHPDDQIRLGRSTDWTHDEEIVRGVGQRVLLVGEDVRPLTSIRDIVLEQPAGATPENDEPASSH